MTTHFFCAFAGVVICFVWTFLFLLFLSLSFLPYDPDHANSWARAPQHSRWPCRCETRQHAEGLGWVHAAVRLLSLRPLQAQRDPHPQRYLLSLHLQVRIPGRGLRRDSQKRWDIVISKSGGKHIQIISLNKGTTAGGFLYGLYKRVG